MLKDNVRDGIARTWESKARVRQEDFLQQPNLTVTSPLNIDSSARRHRRAPGGIGKKSAVPISGNIWTEYGSISIARLSIILSQPSSPSRENAS